MKQHAYWVSSECREDIRYGLYIIRNRFGALAPRYHPRSSNARKFPDPEHGIEQAAKRITNMRLFERGTSLALCRHLTCGADATPGKFGVSRPSGDSGRPGDHATMCRGLSDGLHSLSFNLLRPTAGPPPSWHLWEAGRSEEYPSDRCSRCPLWLVASETSVLSSSPVLNGAILVFGPAHASCHLPCSTDRL